MTRYITIRKHSQDTGYSENAIRKKISNGIWPQGHVWIKAPDGRQLIDVEGYEQWVETALVSGKPANQALKSPSPIKASVAANESRLSPRPLT